jgi:hypothetical protein
MISAYLTVSLNFRFFIRNFDDAHESIGFECVVDDSVRIIKLLRDEDKHSFEPVNSEVVSVSQLKREGAFD